MQNRPDPRPEKPGLKVALDALKAPRGPAQEWHAPPPMTLPGPKAKALPGQLDLDGRETRAG
jgi:hypothetical protein